MEAEGQVTLEVYNPSGALKASEQHAPRLDTLNGKTICELSNGIWEAERMFPLIREELKKRYPDIRIIPYTEFPVGNDQIDSAEVAKLVQAKGGQAVISGNAG